MLAGDEAQAAADAARRVGALSMAGERGAPRRAVAENLIKRYISPAVSSARVTPAPRHAQQGPRRDHKLPAASKGARR